MESDDNNLQCAYRQLTSRNNSMEETICRLEKYLKIYREYNGINAKLVVVAMASNKFSIADPNDPNMLDICGFSPETFDAIQEFISLT